MPLEQRDRERYYLSDGAEIRGGNWVETLAMHKSKRYIVLGACFPASVLYYFSKRNCTVVFLPRCFTLVSGRWGEVCKTFTPQLRWICVCVCVCVFLWQHLENASSCGECLPKTEESPCNFMYFPRHYFSVSYLCFFLHFLAPVLVCLKSNRILFSTLTLMMLCWHIRVYESQYFSSWILKRFPLAGITTRLSLHPQPSFLFLFLPILLIPPF